MAANRRSQLITQGVARSPNRAMLRAVGFRDGDFDKPIVGVANGHSTMNPCNAGIQPLVDRAMGALEQAGAKPQVFGVPTVTDGIGMGTEGMKYSLVSREVIADSIETAVNGQMMDGALVIGACDKNMPGGMMAIARMNVPAIYVYGGTIRPGRWKGQDLTIASAFESVGAYAAGKISKEDFEGIEKNACPSVGACGGMFTANTMSMAMELLGISPAGLNGIPARHPEKSEAAASAAGSVIIGMPVIWLSAWITLESFSSSVIARPGMRVLVSWTRSSASSPSLSCACTCSVPRGVSVSSALLIWRCRS